MKDIAHRDVSELSALRLQRLAEAEERIYTVETERTDLLDYWKVLVKRRQLLFAVSLIVFMLGAYINFTTTTLYTATSTIKIEPQNPTVTGVSSVTDLAAGTNEVGPYDYYGTQFALLQSRTVAARVIRDLNLESNPQFNTRIVTANPLRRLDQSVFGTLERSWDFIANLFRFSAKNKNAKGSSGANASVSPWTISQYLTFLEIKPVKNTRLVEVRFNTPYAELSESLANTHATSFIRMILESRFELTKEAREFLDKKMAELRQKLQRAEEELNRFRQAHGVVSFEKGENIIVDRLVDLNRQLTTARSARIEAESLHRVVQTKDFNNLTQVINHTPVQQLKNNIATLEADKARLSAIFTPDHPRLIELNQQISEARRALNQEVATVVRSIESSFAAARAREQALEAEAEKQQQTALSMKEVGVEYAVLQEDVNVNRALYENVLKRLNETNVTNDLAVSNMQIVQRAETPLRPSSPNTRANLTMAAVFGLLLGVGLVFFMEYIDSTLHTPQEVWNAVALNTIGVVPHLKFLQSPDYGAPQFTENGSQHQLPDSKDSSNGHALSKEILGERSQLSIMAESYRMIRTALMLSQAEKPPQVILLTSPCSGDGKTVTTLNLAIVLAQGGHKVLVIDADLRKGRCHKLLGLQNSRGLTSILTGHLPPERGIQETAVKGLSLLARGQLAPNPADLLCSRKMTEVLDRLRESYKFILIDSPPVIAVSDAAFLSALCDGVLLVLNSEQTSAASARRAVDSLGSLGAKFLGVVLNGIDIRNPDYVDFRAYYPYVSKEDDDLDDDEKIIKNSPAFADQRESSVQTPAKTVSKQFMNRIIIKLSEAIGAMAFTIVRERVAALGESMETFPRARIGELAQVLSQEISDPRLKVRFQQTMSEEIRGFFQAT